MGCKSAKHAQQPGSKKPAKNQTGRLHTPVTSPMPAIKPLPAAELNKHKPTDIIEFIKLGNLPMVHGLINHYKLHESVMDLKQVDGTFKMQKGESVSTSEWNPLHHAIAYKKKEIVQYFLSVLKISLRQLGKRPGDEETQSVELAAEQQVFPLLIAIINKDLLMLEELWNQYTSWDSIHLHKLVDIIISEAQGQALQSILKSYTTDAIFSSLPLTRQVELTEYILKQRKASAAPFHRYFDAGLTCKPFTLPAIYVMLETNSEARPATTNEIRTFVEKSHLEITEFDYAFFKFSPQNTVLRQRIQEFEALGDQEKATMKKLTAVFDKYDEKFGAHQYFVNEHEFENLEVDLLSAYLNGDKDKVTKIVEMTDIRRVPLTPGYNSQLRYQELNNHPSNYWPIPLHMLFNKSLPETTMIDYIQTILVSGFNIRQALRIQSGADREELNITEPQVEGAALLIALEKSEMEVLNFLLGQDFVNVWGYSHIQMLIQVVRRERFVGQDVLGAIINSAVAKNVFLGLSVQQRYAFIKEVDTIFGAEDSATLNVRVALSQKPYASYLLIHLIDRDQFKKMNDFTAYLNCLNTVTKTELEELSKVPGNEEQFMNFMRYIQMLDLSDTRKVEGQKLIERIFELEKYNAIKNHSLQIFEHESQILEEEGIDEVSQRATVHSMATNQKVFVKDIDMGIFHQLFKEGIQTGIIGYLREYKLTDIMFLRGSSEEYFNIPKLAADGQVFQDDSIIGSSLNVLQLASAGGMFDVVKYLLQEQKIFSNTKQLRSLDPRFILANQHDEEDESLTLRLAIKSGHIDMFKLLWDNYTHIYTEKHLLDVARFAIHTQKDEFLIHILNSKTSSTLFLNAPIAARVQFVDMFDEKALQQVADRSAIIQTLGQDPYTKLDKQVNDDKLLQIYNYIRLNEVEHLKEIVSAASIQGVAHLLFDFFEEDEDILTLADESKITTAHTNPILLAIKCKSFECLAYLVNTFGVRQSMRQLTITTRAFNRDLTYKNLMMPLIMKTHDNDALTFLLKNEGFVMTSQDFNSFVVQAMFDRWNQGLRTFLWSNTTQFFFATLPWEIQRAIVDRIFRTVISIEEPRLRQTYITSILEETLTKRPYVKHLTQLLLEGELGQSIDGSKLSKECLKNLTSEDFMQMAHMDTDKMAEHERAYTNVQGSSLENELAKIMLRYQNEGKSSAYLANQRKQVTFQEGGIEANQA